MFVLDILFYLEIAMIILIMGVSGSGKSRIGQKLAEDINFEFKDADDFHPEKNVEKMRQNIPLNDSDRQPWLQRMQAEIDHWLEQNQNVVLACSALKEEYRKILWRDDQVMKLVYLKGSYQLIKERLKNRSNHFMKADLLQSQFETLEEPQGGIWVDISLPPPKILQKIRANLSI